MRLFDEEKVDTELGDKNNLEEFLDEKKDTIRDSLGWFSS
jgi:hypothetical protein